MTKKSKERPRRPHERPSLGYTGWKYKTEELTLPLMWAEVGILETDAILGRRMTDRDVRAALEALILTMRARPNAPLEEAMRVDSGNHFELLAANILRNWQDFFRDHPQPIREELVGILRTILGSVEQRKSADPESRSYLTFLAGFLAQAGVRTVRVRPDAERESAHAISDQRESPPPKSAAS